VTTPVCQTHDPEIWFPERTVSNAQYKRDVQHAKALCGACPLRVSCLAEALRREGSGGKESRAGIWGATTPDERARLYRAANTARAESRVVDTQAEHEARYEMWLAGSDDVEIASARGVSISGVSTWRRRHGLEPRGGGSRRPLSPAEFNKRMRLYRQGMSDAEIGKRCNVSDTGIYSWRQRNNLPRAERRERVAS
jgi:hypothetical protein